MNEYVKNYRESMDVFSLCHLEKDIEKAIIRSLEKNKRYDGCDILEKNPYTEVQHLVQFLISLNNDK